MFVLLGISLLFFSFGFCCTMVSILRAGRMEDEWRSISNEWNQISRAWHSIDLFCSDADIDVEEAVGYATARQQEWTE